MNFPKSIMTIMLASLMFVGCKDKTTESNMPVTSKTETPKVKKEIVAANLQTASFTIKGMSCEIGCAKTIEEELNGLDGVKIAAVNFKKESATVSFDKTVLTPEELTKVVEATADGKTYKVSNMKL
ncbi:heavy-metal-associated domain-containing protein [Flavobacterium soyangense]|uniref:Heavy-metal-associated domain-containing protein n=1 Tax=Flavobacterium soyangense TaxID=2023265 RepID=A0A930UG40_9FLAO|nr:heavy metal-associated domain-containing protein [Flavobacterium soyangense]MBF2709840.1 heavy-metal-associated domain-containing protein [Flavobacterium soyangense]